MAEYQSQFTGQQIDQKLNKVDTIEQAVDTVESQVGTLQTNMQTAQGDIDAVEQSVQALDTEVDGIADTLNDIQAGEAKVGYANKADLLNAARTVTFEGDIEGSYQFDGSENKTVQMTGHGSKDTIRPIDGTVYTTVQQIYDYCHSVCGDTTTELNTETTLFSLKKAYFSGIIVYSPSGGCLHFIGDYDGTFVAGELGEGNIEDAIAELPHIKNLDSVRPILGSVYNTPQKVYNYLQSIKENEGGENTPFLFSYNGGSSYHGLIVYAPNYSGLYYIGDADGIFRMGVLLNNDTEDMGTAIDALPDVESFYAKADDDEIIKRIDGSVYNTPKKVCERVQSLYEAGGSKNPLFVLNNGSFGGLLIWQASNWYCYFIGDADGTTDTPVCGNLINTDETPLNNVIEDFAISTSSGLQVIEGRAEHLDADTGVTIPIDEYFIGAEIIIYDNNLNPSKLPLTEVEVGIGLAGEESFAYYPEGGNTDKKIDFFKIDISKFSDATSGEYVYCNGMGRYIDGTGFANEQYFMSVGGLQNITLSLSWSQYSAAGSIDYSVFWKVYRNAN